MTSKGSLRMKISDEVVELNSKTDAGLELISALGDIELKPSEIRDLLYNLISKDYRTIDEILDTAEKEKLLQRTEKTYSMTPEASDLEFEKPKIVKQVDRDNCRFCRRKLSMGYYVVFKSHTYGPYGSSCIRKIYLDHLL
jgi:hypothetical protein